MEYRNTARGDSVSIVGIGASQWYTFPAPFETYTAIINIMVDQATNHQNLKI
jgi:hypothetical protein